MLDVAPTELLLVAVVALLVIGPKDLPRAMQFVGRWVGRARGIARQFRSGFDDIVREAELKEMEKRWASENARIMREHPPSEEIIPDYVRAPEPDFSQIPGVVVQPQLIDAPHPESDATDLPPEQPRPSGAAGQP